MDRLYGENCPGKPRLGTVRGRFPDVSSGSFLRLFAASVSRAKRETAPQRAFRAVFRRLGTEPVGDEPFCEDSGGVQRVGQKVGAPPVPGGLSRPERHSAAFGTPGIAPAFCSRQRRSKNPHIAGEFPTLRSPRVPEATSASTIPDSLVSKGKLQPLHFSAENTLKEMGGESNRRNGEISTGDDRTGMYGRRRME